MPRRPMLSGAVRWNVWPSRSGAWINSADGVDDVVDRNDVGASGVGQQHRSERRQLGQLRQDGEEVVRPVDLVHFAGARITDDHRGPIDAVAQAGLRAHQRFGLELRLVIRRRQILRDVEVLFGVLAAIGPGDRDRRHVVQRRVQPTRERDHRPCAVDVRGALRVLGGGDVVDGGAVHHMVDGAQLADGLVGEPEILRGQVADQRLGPITPRLVASAWRAARTWSTTPDGQGPRPGIGGPVQNSRDDSATNKPGTAGNDIAHAVMVVRWPANVNAM